MRLRGSCCACFDTLQTHAMDGHVPFAGTLQSSTPAQMVLLLLPCMVLGAWSAVAEFPLHLMSLMCV